ncbi:MAG: hypothetical protein OEY52_00445 [Gammaproteobacteria bacterium]|nr:hypothetical protein [Gammaproteobacteria bacterium]
MQLMKYCLTVCLVFSMSSLHADDTEEGSSAITFEIGQDTDDSQEAYLNVDTGLENGVHIKWMSGGTRLPAESDIFETRSRSIGISSPYGKKVVAGFDYDYWGNPDTIETRTRRFKLGTNTEDWYVQLVYEDRVTRLRTNGSFINRRGVVVDLPDTADINSNGRGLDISFYGFFPFSINLSYMEYDYDKDLTAVAKHPDFLLILFPASTLSMTTGLESWRRSGDISYSFEWGTFGISGSQSESVVDESIASTGSLYLILDINKNWSSTFTWGESGTDTSDETVRFARLGITHRW